jgi:hypothetical protein
MINTATANVPTDSTDASPLLPNTLAEVKAELQVTLARVALIQEAISVLENSATPPCFEAVVATHDLRIPLVRANGTTMKECIDDINDQRRNLASGIPTFLFFQFKRADGTIASIAVSHHDAPGLGTAMLEKYVCHGSKDKVVWSQDMRLGFEE